MMVADHTPHVHDGRGATGQAKICEAVDIGDPEKHWSHAASRRVLCGGSEGPTMANAAQDWTNILKGLGDPDGPIPALAAAPANDRAVAGADRADVGGASEPEVWSETLARVYGAADLLRTREHQLRDLEQVHRAAMERAADRIAALEQQLAAEGERAHRAERAQAAAEEWLRRIHTAVVEQFPD
jgi:hypothetical protein